MGIRSIKWISCALVIACQGGEGRSMTQGGTVVVDAARLRALSDVTPGEWEALAARRVFFGHQSVGANVIQGITEVLADHPEIGLTLVARRDLLGSAPPGFYHATVGRNQHPDEKLQDFGRVLSDGSFPSGSVGFVKFCYVDVTHETHSEALFEAYRQRMAELKANNPGVTIVHFTMPLRTDEGRLRSWVQKVRGRATERDRNVVRNRYNALLRSAYLGTEPVFDLAAIESRNRDGSVSGFQRNDVLIQTLAPELSSDGGHLNEVGRRLVAEHLLVFLATELR